MILAFIGILIYVLHEPEIVDWKAVESEWYTETPYQNKLTFYEDGTYKSESWGAPTGTWEALDNQEELLLLWLHQRKGRGPGTAEVKCPP